MSFLHLDWQQNQLQNGLRVLTIRRPYTPTVALRLYVRAGSRYDSQETGVAHLLEHLIFAGTQNRTNRQVFADVERVGGRVGGHTHREYISLWMVGPARDWSKGLDVLADLTCHPLLDEEAFQKEKRVVVEEIRGAQDKETILYDLFAQTLWQNHPLRHPLRGRLENLTALSHSKLLAFYQHRFVTGNSVLVACGDLDHDEFLRQARTLFADMSPGPERSPTEEVANASPNQPLTVHLPKNVYQSYLMMGVPTVSMNNSDRSALKLIERMLGMGGSSRLYYRLREEKALVYTFHVLNVHYEDKGYFATRATSSPENISQVETEILEEWSRLRAGEMSELEIEIAKNNYIGSLARNFETNLAIASIFGVEALLGVVEPFAESLARVQATDHGHVREAARKYLNPNGYVKIIVGRKEDEEN